jgi:hypothetical protein
VKIRRSRSERDDDASQYATPRWELKSRDVRPSCGSNTQRRRPVSASRAKTRLRVDT